MGGKFLELIHSNLSRPKMFLDIIEKEDSMHVNTYPPGVLGGVVRTRTPNISSEFNSPPTLSTSTRQVFHK